MRTSVVVLVLVVLVFVTACGRANPRIAKIVRAQGGSRQTTTFDYDDSGHPSEVRADFGGGVTQTYSFDFEGGQLGKLTLLHEAGGGETKDVTELEYDAGQLTKSTTDIGDSDQTVTTTIDYDGSGHIKEVERKTAFGSGSNVETTSYSFKDGVIESIESKSAFETAGQGVSASKETTTVTYKDGKIDTLELDNDNGDTGTIAATYKDGVLDELSFDGEQNGQPSSGKGSYEYEDGRLVGATLSSDDSDDTDLSLEYEDGDAADIDMAPSALFLGLWDLRGNSFTNLDARTQAARFAGANW